MGVVSSFGVETLDGGEQLGLLVGCEGLQVQRVEEATHAQRRDRHARGRLALRQELKLRIVTAYYRIILGLFTLHLSVKHLLLLHRLHQLRLILCLCFLGFLLLFLPADEPFRVANHLGWWYLLRNTSLIGIILPFLELLTVLLVVHSVQFPHLFDLVEVDNEALLVSVVLLDAFPAEDGQVVRAVEMLDSLVVLVAEQALDAVLVLKVQVAKDWVTLDDLVEDVEVQGKLVDALDLLDELSTDRAAHSEVVVQHLEALCTKGVATVDEDARNSLAHVELVTTIVAIVQAPSSIISLYNDLWPLLVLSSLLFSLLSFSSLFERPMYGLLDFHTAPTGPGLESIWSLGR